MTEDLEEITKIRKEDIEWVLSKCAAIKSINGVVSLKRGTNNKQELHKLIGRPVEPIDSDKICYVPYIRLDKARKKR